MTGLSVTAGAANTSLVVLVFDNGNEVYGYNTSTDKGELLSTSVYTLTYTDSSGNTVMSSDDWATVTATVTSGNYAGLSGSTKKAFFMAYYNDLADNGNGRYETKLSRIVVYPGIKKIAAYDHLGNPLPKNSLINISYTHEVFESGSDPFTTFPTAPGNYYAYFDVSGNGNEQSVVPVNEGSFGYYGGADLRVSFTIGESSDVDLGSCTMEIDGGIVTISNNGTTVPSSAYTVTFYDEGTALGSTFPTEAGKNYWALATAIDGSGYTGKVSSEKFEVPAAPIAENFQISFDAEPISAEENFRSMILRWESDTYLDCTSSYWEIYGGLVVSDEEIARLKAKFPGIMIADNTVPMDWTAFTPQATQVPDGEYGMTGYTYQNGVYTIPGSLRVLGPDEEQFDEYGNVLGVYANDQVRVKIYSEGWSQAAGLVESAVKTVTLEYTEANVAAGKTFYEDSDLATPISLSDCILIADPITKTVRLMMPDEATLISESAYTLSYYAITTNTDPVYWGTEFPEGGEFYAVAEAVQGSGYTGTLQSSNFISGMGSFAMMSVDAQAQSVTVFDYELQPISPSDYELVFFAVSNDGSEEYAGDTFPTAQGTYVCIAKGLTGESMVQSEKFTVEAAEEKALGEGTVEVDADTQTVTVKDKDGAAVPRSAYTLMFSMVRDDGDPITLEGEAFPTDEGDYYVTAVAVQGSGYTGHRMSVKFTVKDSVRPVINVSTAKINKGSKVTLKVTVKSNDVTKEAQWTSSDESVATVAEGVVTGVGAGTATITAALTGAGEVSCEVQVVNVAPEPPTVTVVEGDGQATFSWVSMEGVTKYAVSMYEDSAFTVLDQNIKGTSYTAAGLTNGKEYKFLVQAYNGKWSSKNTKYLISVTPYSTVPTVTATEGNGQVTLSWISVDGATKYCAAMYEDNAYTILDKNITGTSFTVTGLTNGKEYKFLVQSYVNKKWSSKDTKYLVSATPVSAAEPQVTVTEGDGQVTLSWISVDGATKYCAAMYEDNAYTILDQNITDTSYTVKGLTNGKEYKFLVQARVNGKWSSKDTKYLVSATPFTTIPTVTVTAGDGEVTLSWSSINGAVKYCAALYENSAFTILDQNITDTSYTVKGLTNGKTYKFLVQSYTNKKWSSKSTKYLVSAMPKPATVPTVTVKAGDGQATFSWISVDGATKYAVSMYEDSTFSVLNQKITGTSFTAKNLTNGKTYKFLVQAYVNKWSSKSTKYLVSVTPYSTVPQVTVTAGDGQAAFSWISVDGATKYCAAIYENGKYTILDQNITGTSYTATGLTNGKEYNFLIQAYANGKWSSKDTQYLISVTPNA